jgi:hypothetical protein
VHSPCDVYTKTFHGGGVIFTDYCYFKVRQNMIELLLSEFPFQNEYCVQHEDILTGFYLQHIQDCNINNLL